MSLQGINLSLSPQLQARLVRYADLRPCTNAFIDARSPGSDKKENFTIIGPGVAENPAQHVHIREPHGFNIGGARQPPGCTNSLHSHHSEEVFIIHSGAWRFFWGEHGDAGEVDLAPGDTISIPINVFRGFENIGDSVGFMFAILGGDDPGRVHWAPHVITNARGHGLVLLENGSLVDTTLGETVPKDATVVHPSTRQDIAYIRIPSLEEMTGNVVRHTALGNLPVPEMAPSGVREVAIISAAPNADGHASAPIARPHGFTLLHLALDAGAKTALHARDCVEVLLVHRGYVHWQSDTGDHVELNAGDTFTVPRGMGREIEAITQTELFVVLGGNDPGPARLLPTRIA